MKIIKLLPAVILSLAIPAHATLIATAEGIATSGCNDCQSTGYDTFGLGANADLAGMAFSLTFTIDELLFTRTPFINAENTVIWYTPKTSDWITAAITLNNMTFDLPLPGNYMPSFGVKTDGTHIIDFQHEGPEDISETQSLFTYGHLSATELGHAFLLSHQELLNIPSGGGVSLGETTLTGTIGEFAFSTATVPEPSPLPLLGAGLAILLLRRREG